MATRTISNAGGNWNATTAWVEGAVPTSADDVVATATSGNLTINVAAACRSIDLLNYVGTLTHAAAITLTIGTSTANGSAIGLRFPTTMTYTLGNAQTSAITFSSTSATQQTVAFQSDRANVHGNLTFNTGSWSIITNVSASNTAVVFNAGTLNLGASISWGSFTSNTSSTRTLTLNASFITVGTSSTQAWNLQTVTNMTLNAGTSAINVNGTAGGFTGGGFTYYTVNITGTGTHTVFGGNTFTNFSYVATAADDTLNLQSLLTQVITGSLTLTGVSSNSRASVRSTIDGSVYFIDVTSATFSATDVNLHECRVVRPAGPVSGTRLGDGGNNVNVTFQTPRTLYWVGGAGSASDATNHWATSSGGAGGATNFPLPQDDMIFDANSITVDATAVTWDRLYMGHNLDLSALAHTVAFAVPSIFLLCYGNVTLNAKASWSNGFNLYMFGYGAATLTTNGVTLTNVALVAQRSAVTLVGNLILPSFNLTVAANSSFDANGYNVTTIGLGTAGTLTMGSGTWTLTGTGTVWNKTGGTIAAGTSTIVISDTSSASKTFAGGIVSYNNLTITPGGTGSVTITGGNNTFARITCLGQKNLKIAAGTTVTVTTAAGWNVQGNPGMGVRLAGASGSYISTPDSVGLSVLGDLDLRCKATLDSWTPANFPPLIAKAASNTNFSFNLYINGSGGQLGFKYSSDGTTQFTATSTAATGAAAGSTLWCRVTYTAATGQVIFYTSPDGSTWTQLGTTRFVTAGAIYDGTAAVELGSQFVGATNPLAGSINYAEIRNGINGTVVGSFDASTTAGATTRTQTDAQGNVWTATATTQPGGVFFNSATAGTFATLSVASGIVASDYLSVQDNHATGGATFYAGSHSTNVSGNTGWTFTSYTAVTGSDTLGTTDVATRSGSLARTGADSLGTTDVAALPGGQARTAADTLGTTDRAVHVRLRRASDTLGTTDSALGAAIRARTGSDSLGTRDRAGPLLPGWNDWPDPLLAANPGLGTSVLNYTPDSTGAVLGYSATGGWRNYGQVYVDYTQGASRYGLIAIGSGTAGVAVTPGDMVFYRCAVKATGTGVSTASYFQLNPAWYDASGSLVSTGISGRDCTYRYELPGQWAMIEGWTLVPTGAATMGMNVEILTGASSGAAAQLALSAPQIATQTDRWQPWVDGNQPGCSWQGTPNASKSVRTADYINLVPNPNFDRGSAGWQVGFASATSPSIALDTSWAESGSSSLRTRATLTSATTGYVEPLGTTFADQGSSAAIPVVGGQEYTARVKVNVRALPAGGRIQLVIAWGANGSFVSSSASVNTTVTGVQELVLTVTAPRYATSGLPTVAGNQAVGFFDFSIDGVMLIPDSGAQPTKGMYTGFNDQVFNSGPISLTQTLADAADIGVNAIRPPLGALLNSAFGLTIWPSAASAINLDPLAPYLDPIQAAGLKVILLSGYLPWMVSGGQLDVVNHAGNYGKISGAIAARWTNVIAWEPFNEPNTSQFWGNTPKVQSAIDCLAAARPQFKALAPNIPIIGMTVNAAKTTAFNMSITDYMTAFYAQGGRPYLDALSIHPYPSAGPASGGRAVAFGDFYQGLEDSMFAMRQVMQANGDSTANIWVTEYGLPTTPPTGSSPPYILNPGTEDQQGVTIRLLQQWARRQPGVVSSIIHVNQQTSSSWDLGLKTPAGRKKPAWDILKAQLYRGMVAPFTGDSGGSWTGTPGASASITTAHTVTAIVGVDSLGTTDVATRFGLSLARTGADALGTSDAATRGLLLTRLAVDVLGTSDLAVRAESLARVAVDALGTSDSALGSLSAIRIGLDVLGTTDVATRAGLARSRTASDTLGTSDTAVRGVLLLIRTASDALGTSDVGTRGPPLLLRLAADALSTTDVAGRVLQTSRLATDTLGTSDSAVRGVRILTRAAVDSLGTGDIAASGAFRVLTGTDTLGTTDSASRTSLSRIRSASDALGTSDAAVRLPVVLRIATDALLTSDAAVNGGALRARLALDSITPTDAAGRAASHIRFAADGISPLDQAVTFTRTARTGTDLLLTSDLARVTVTKVIVAFDAITPTDAATATRALPRVAFDSAAMTEQALANAAFRITASDSLSTHDAAVVTVGVPSPVRALINVRALIRGNLTAYSATRVTLTISAVAALEDHAEIP